MLIKTKKKLFPFLLGLLLVPMNGYATETEKGKIDVGKIVMDHISDDHSWEIAAIGDKIIAIPLPVILWHNGEIHAFMSSKFQHGHATYRGFKLASETDGEDLRGKIIAVDENGCYAGVKPFDFSITKNVLFLFLVSGILFWIVFYTRAAAKRNTGKPPKGLQTLIEILICFLRDEIAKPSIGEKKHAAYMPFLLTVFFFILLSNLMGIIPLFPFGANLTGNIAVTMVLAIFTFLQTTFSGNKHYWKEIFNNSETPWWLKFPIPLMPIIEIVSMLIKPFVLMIRLFANILAGHIILLSFVCAIFVFGEISVAAAYGVAIVPVLFGVFIDLLEILVAAVQAYVFTLLSALYIGMATAEHETENATKKTS